MLYVCTILFNFTLLYCTYEVCFSTQLLLCPHPLYRFMVQLSFTALHFTVLLILCTHLPYHSTVHPCCNLLSTYALYCTALSYCIFYLYSSMYSTVQPCRTALYCTSLLLSSPEPLYSSAELHCTYPLCSWLHCVSHLYSQWMH